MSLLIPLVLPREQSLVDGNLRELAGFDVVLFGYWQTPEGTDPAAVREANEPEAKAELYDLAAKFSRAGASTDVTLSFGPADEHLSALQEQIAETVDPDAVVLPERITQWNNVLVPLRDDRNAERIVDFLSAFDRESMFALELYHAATDEADVEPAREMLEGVARTLLDRGFTEADLEVTVEVVEDPEAAIVERAGGHNVVVIGATDREGDAGRVVGEVYERIADSTAVPVAVVRPAR